MIVAVTVAIIVAFVPYEPLLSVLLARGSTDASNSQSQRATQARPNQKSPTPAWPKRSVWETPGSGSGP